MRIGPGLELLAVVPVDFLASTTGLQGSRDFDFLRNVVGNLGRRPRWLCARLPGRDGADHDARTGERGFLGDTVDRPGLHTGAVDGAEVRAGGGAMASCAGGGGEEETSGAGGGGGPAHAGDAALCAGDPARRRARMEAGRPTREEARVRRRRRVRVEAGRRARMEHGRELWGRRQGSHGRFGPGGSV